MAQQMEQRSGWAVLQRRSPGGRQGKRLWGRNAGGDGLFGISDYHNEMTQ